MKKTFIRFLIALILSVFGLVFYHFVVEKDNAANTHQDTMHIVSDLEEHTQK